MDKDQLEKVLPGVLASIVQVAEDELASKTQEQLEEYWFFRYDPKLPIERTLYDFFDMLTLYTYWCAEWEKRHGGTTCLAKRVLDKYVLPKIKELRVALGLLGGIASGK